MKALIVLGGGINKQGNMPAWVISRLNKAVAEWQSDDYSLLITTGKGRAENRETEAEVMKKFLVTSGLPAECIETEGESTSTIENAYFCRVDHIEPKGIESMTIVTNRFHIERAASIFRFIFGESYEVQVAVSADDGITAKDHAVLVAADKEQAQFLVDHIFDKFKAGNVNQIKNLIFDKENESAKAWADYKASSDSYKKVTELMT